MILHTYILPSKHHEKSKQKKILLKIQANRKREKKYIKQKK